MSYTLLTGDARTVLADLPANSVQTCITSPPYYQLRDYSSHGQIGQEQTPGAYVDALTAILDRLWRVLSADGTLWLNLGDCYSATKSLIGIPWRVAFALQDRGWILRSEIIWQKPNAMPTPVRDRPTSSHEQLFLFAKQPRYFYNADAIREPYAASSLKRIGQQTLDQQTGGAKSAAYQAGTTGRKHQRDRTPAEILRAIRSSADKGRNARDVWSIATRGYTGAHFATFPRELARRCILAGSRPGDTVIDPFNGAATTGAEALSNARQYIGIDLNPEYISQSRARLDALDLAR